MDAKVNIVDMTAEIVSAYVGHNSVASDDLSSLIKAVYLALHDAAEGNGLARSEPLRPAISVKKSITPDYLICLEDGKKFKSLKRHLRTHYDLSPEAYRAKWGLPQDYPMVAPKYAAARSQLARDMGLGQKAKPKRRRGKASAG